MKYLIILLLLLPTSLNSARLIGKDYPYYIFNDKGTIRFCEDPTEDKYTTTICWANGEDSICDVVTPEEGYINCKQEDE